MTANIDDDGPRGPQLAAMYADPLESMGRAVWLMATRPLEDVLPPQAGARFDDLPGTPALWSLGGVYAAHVLRLHGWSLIDAATDDAPPAWAEIITRHAAAIGLDPDAPLAIEAALELRRARSGDAPGAAPIGHDLAGWLGAPDAASRIPWAVKLVRRVRTLPDAGRAYYQGAWWSHHGRAVAERLGLAGDERRPGRPRADNTSRRQREVIALGMWSARRWSKSTLAECVGTSRPTLDAWLAAPGKAR